MREILFRGKRVDNGEWVEGSLILTTSTKEKTYIVDSCYCYDGCINKDGYADFDRLNAFEVIPETVGQFAGLTDKNDKKVFEGDIITASVYEREYDDEYLSNTPIQVTYCGGYFYPFYLDGCWRSGVSDIEIIGNIHDNPELLKGGAE